MPSGKSPISQKATVKRGSLEILDVREADAGTFTCASDGNSYEVVLLVVSGEEKLFTSMGVGGVRVRSSGEPDSGRGLGPTGWKSRSHAERRRLVSTGGWKTRPGVEESDRTPTRRV